jgi:hypothetical protein
VKTASSIRKVPAHPHLLKVGLLRYCQSLLEAYASVNAENRPLWPDLKSVAEGKPLSAPWSQWFGRFLRQTAGVKDRRKVFHSFRHSFKRMARNAGVPEEFHDAITGHAGGGSVGKSYGRGVSLKPLLEAMERHRQRCVTSFGQRSGRLLHEPPALSPSTENFTINLQDDAETPSRQEQHIRAQPRLAAPLQDSRDGGRYPHTHPRRHPGARRADCGGQLRGRDREGYGDGDGDGKGPAGGV